MSVNEAPLLVVAGVHNERSLGWAAAEAWLERDPEHQLLATVRGEKGQDFIKEKALQVDERILSVTVDWTASDAVSILKSALSAQFGNERVIGGVVHAVAAAEEGGKSFNTPAHEVPAEAINAAIDNSVSSLQRLVLATSDNLRVGGGIVTYGFGEPDNVSPSYGVMNEAKAALSKRIQNLAVSLGAADSPARTLEIITGYVATDSGRGVAVAQRKRPKELAAYFQEEAALKSTSSEEQWRAAGQLAVSFMLDPWFSETTGERIHVDGGYSIKAKAL